MALHRISPAKVNFIPIILAIAAGVVLYLALLFNLGGKQQIALWAVFSAGALALLFIGRGCLRVSCWLWQQQVYSRCFR